MSPGGYELVAPEVVRPLGAQAHLRHRLFAEASRRHGLPLLYVNQVGGQDQLVFDGASFAVEPQAGVVFEARRFEEDITTLRFEAGRFLGAGGDPYERCGGLNCSTS